MFFFGKSKQNKGLTDGERLQHLVTLSEAIAEQQPYFIISGLLSAYAKAETDAAVFKTTLDKTIDAVTAYDAPQKGADILAICLRDQHITAIDILFTEKLFALTDQISQHEIGNLDAFEKIGRRCCFDKELAAYVMAEWPRVGDTLSDQDKAHQLTFRLCCGAVHPSGMMGPEKPSEVSDRLIGYVLDSMDRNARNGNKTYAKDYLGYSGLYWTKKGSAAEQSARHHLLAAITMAKTPDQVAEIVEATTDIQMNDRPDPEIDAVGTAKWKALTQDLPDEQKIRAARTVIGDRLNRIIGEGRLLDTAVGTINDALSEALTQQKFARNVIKLAKIAVKHKLGAHKETMKLLKLARDLGIDQKPQGLTERFKDTKVATLAPAPAARNTVLAAGLKSNS